VLIVEDEADLAVTYQRLLARWGYRVVVAGSRRAALTILADRRVRLVIADLGLPDGDGMDLVRAARSLPSPPPVLVATSFVSPARQREALAAGAAAVLLKPFACDALRRLVVELLTGERLVEATVGPGLSHAWLARGTDRAR
jgi:DNA-binding response OmpR family regulator